MIVGGVAPFVFAAIKSMFTERTALVATIAAMNSGQQLLKVLLFGFFGVIFNDWYLMMTTGYLGTLTGRIFLERFTAEQVQPILKLVLTLMGIRLLFLGCTADQTFYCEYTSGLYKLCRPTA